MKKILMLKCNVGKVRFVRIIQSLIYSFLAPRVGCLNFHSLLELRRGLQYGSFGFHWRIFINQISSFQVLFYLIWTNKH
jgi:hypothetical protein